MSGKQWSGVKRLPFGRYQVRQDRPLWRRLMFIPCWCVTHEPEDCEGTSRRVFDEPPRSRSKVARLREALEHIADGEQCENFTGPPWCRDPRSGRSRDAQYTADRWCQTCIARDALERES